jgi:hypothetical protein
MLQILRPNCCNTYAHTAAIITPTLLVQICLNPLWVVYAKADFTVQAGLRTTAFSRKYQLPTVKNTHRKQQHIIKLKAHSRLNSTRTLLTMVNLSLPLLAVLALAVSVTAAPATSATSFTFAQWIEDIIANPDGDHLTPEQAVEAKNAAVAVSNPLNVRAPRCMEGVWARANV